MCRDGFAGISDNGNAFVPDGRQLSYRFAAIGMRFGMGRGIALSPMDTDRLDSFSYYGV